MARIAIVATTDLVSDQRVHRTAFTLSMQHSVVAYGRWLPLTTQKPQRGYSVRLLRMIFGKGFLFYAEFNLRMFFLLLFSRVDLIYSNDLDTLLACKLASVIRQKPLVFDAHELFSELPELIGRKVPTRIWRALERLLVPRCEHSITVSEGIAGEYKVRYGVAMSVVRNVPFAATRSGDTHEPLTIIYQGALNVGRGLERLIESMVHLPSYTLLIAGEGDLSIALRKLVGELDLHGRVHFLGRLPLEMLAEQTARASLGVSLEEDLGLNYRFALPNKLFDYIQLRVPVLVSNLPDMKSLVDTFDVGLVSEAKNAHELALDIEEAFNNTARFNKWIINTEKAAQQLCWETESLAMLSVVERALKGKD
ncbi:MAG: glycosyltransferase [Bacteroidales bacterium]|nr:glycosyltransferase [Bacteroidales bacterium]MBN2750860.1 glycosyltransferase [Bacteroidales bacterium]